jgi:hypothetical protein
MSDDVCVNCGQSLDAHEMSYAGPTCPGGGGRVFTSLDHPHGHGHLFGFRCVCVGTNKAEGTAVFEENLAKWRFTLPVFGPGYPRVEESGLRVGGEYWLELRGKAPVTKRKGKKR